MVTTGAATELAFTLATQVRPCLPPDARRDRKPPICRSTKHHEFVYYDKMIREIMCGCELPYLDPKSPYYLHKEEHAKAVYDLAMQRMKENPEGREKMLQEMEKEKAKWDSS